MSTAFRLERAHASVTDARSQDNFNKRFRAESRCEHLEATVMETQTRAEHNMVELTQQGDNERAMAARHIAAERRLRTNTMARIQQNKHAGMLSRAHDRHMYQ